ncbi:MAG: type I restriction-modification system subunit M [Cyanobacteria bacterium RI_101]|nr:type I restriction-modification system subunit M [Cyanobacteria bacterium RI_101]
MNKQQLAAKIWESANQMRSKIEANEYKDYILGFIFYKYLSDQLVSFAKQEGMTDGDIAALKEDDAETVAYFQKNLGYFMAYDHLFSTWLAAGSHFDVSQVRDGLSAFGRLIHDHHKKLFEGIFNTLETGLSKLGENAAKQTKAIRDLLYLIKDIPMDGKRGYDALGYIYEYLIAQFASNAGKKAGEFYTPHEVSLLMSEIVAHHLKDREQIEIYDPTSGSGSLLINIGSSVAKYLDNTNNIKYYAQELKANTYNLTRMNLVMRGILPSNIVTRNGDTLEEDWPYFEENDPIGSYNPLYVDAVVSNPPYSQKWDSTDKSADPRYSRFGLAPKTKADYAFLLHDLYHLKPDGMMTIVLPHGVLFRGGEEGEIRKNLIEQNHIDAIIGLPANIFFGTGIPTVILVLRQKREHTDILIVDASKYFVKEGKNNRLQASDIKRIADTVIQRRSAAKFSRVVSKAEIRQNDYNLNIPRYVDSAEDGESWDLRAIMLGGIPQKEINQLGAYWQAFPQLRETLFTAGDYAQLCLQSDLLKDHITQHPEVRGFSESYRRAFGDFEDFLNRQLIENWQGVNRNQQEAILSEDLFARLQAIPLIDKYQAYQLLNNHWQVIGTDLEILQTEGFEASKQVDPNLVIKKKNGQDTEVQDGWKGHVLPFELAQGVYLSEQLQALKPTFRRLAGN